MAPTRVVQTAVPMLSIPESADAREGVHTPRQVLQPNSPESEPTQYESRSQAPSEATTAPGDSVPPPTPMPGMQRMTPGQIENPMKTVMHFHETLIKLMETLIKDSCDRFKIRKKPLYTPAETFRKHSEASCSQPHRQAEYEYGSLNDSNYHPLRVSI